MSVEDRFSEFQARTAGRQDSLGDLDWTEVKSYLATIPTEIERVDFLSVLARLPDDGVVNGTVTDPRRHTQNQRVLRQLRTEQSELLSHHFNLESVLNRAECMSDHQEALAFLWQMRSDYAKYHPATRQNCYTPDDLNFCNAVDAQIQRRKDLGSFSALNAKNVGGIPRTTGNPGDTQLTVPTVDSQTGEDRSIKRARRLLQQARAMSRDLSSVDEPKAVLIIEYARDAIDLFGKTHQTQKVELRKIIERAESAVAPESIDSLKKRAEKLFLRLIYPKDPRLRNAFLALGGLVIVASLAAPLVIKLRGSNAKTDSPGKLPASAGPRSSASARTNSITFRGYYETYLKLGDRFLEKEEFSSSLIGTEVTWIGYVDSVSTTSDDELTLMIRTSKETSFPGEDFWQAVVLFDPEWRTKLYSFRRLDKVQVTGIVRQAAAAPGLRGVFVSLIEDDVK
jgi:hypothetical protein